MPLPRTLLVLATTAALGAAIFTAVAVLKPQPEAGRETFPNSIDPLRAAGM